ncbi:hypothetical protein HK098_007251 [Nowakowskiella sp. JEL0407]|nr:hypothetical protein HK098_007251 [Nowakowskiella sp. JEL0407]
MNVELVPLTEKNLQYHTNYELSKCDTKLPFIQQFVASQQLNLQMNDYASVEAPPILPTTKNNIIKPSKRSTSSADLAVLTGKFTPETKSHGSLKRRWTAEYENMRIEKFPKEVFSDPENSDVESSLKFGSDRSVVVLHKQHVEKPAQKKVLSLRKRDGRIPSSSSKKKRSYSRKSRSPTNIRNSQEDEVGSFILPQFQGFSKTKPVIDLSEKENDVQKLYGSTQVESLAQIREQKRKDRNITKTVKKVVEKTAVKRKAGLATKIVEDFKAENIGSERITIKSDPSKRLGIFNKGKISERVETSNPMCFDENAFFNNAMESKLTDRNTLKEKAINRKIPDFFKPRDDKEMGATEETQTLTKKKPSVDSVKQSNKEKQTENRKDEPNDRVKESEEVDDEESSSESGKSDYSIKRRAAENLNRSKAKDQVEENNLERECVTVDIKSIQKALKMKEDLGEDGIFKPNKILVVQPMEKMGCIDVAEELKEITTPITIDEKEQLESESELNETDGDELVEHNENEIIQAPRDIKEECEFLLGGFNLPPMLWKLSSDDQNTENEVENAHEWKESGNWIEDDTYLNANMETSRTGQSGDFELEGFRETVDYGNYELREHEEIHDDVFQSESKRPSNVHNEENYANNGYVQEPLYEEEISSIESVESDQMNSDGQFELSHEFSGFKNSVFPLDLHVSSRFKSFRPAGSSRSDDVQRFVFRPHRLH